MRCQSHGFLRHFFVTPSNSNITRPGFTTATQNSGAPLPYPCEFPQVFTDGLVRKIRIQSLPPFLMYRVRDTRHASICRPLSSATQRLQTIFAERHRIAGLGTSFQTSPLRFAVFTLLGINIVIYLPQLSQEQLLLQPFPSSIGITGSIGIFLPQLPWPVHPTDLSQSVWPPLP